jgi:hypothetical protein
MITLWVYRTRIQEAKASKIVKETIELVYSFDYWKTMAQFNGGLYRLITG